MNDAILRRVIGTSSDHLQIADALLKVYIRSELSRPQDQSSILTCHYRSRPTHHTPATLRAKKNKN